MTTACPLPKKNATHAGTASRGLAPLLVRSLRRARPLAALLLLICLCALYAARAAAQSSAANVQHTENKPDQALKGDLRVDPSTLGMSVSIPFGSYPGRAGTGLPVSLSYSSKVWRIEYVTGWQGHLGYYTQSITEYAEHSASGWTSSLDSPRVEFTGVGQLYDPANGKAICETCAPSGMGQNLIYVKRIHVHLPDGSSHELRVDDAGHEYLPPTADFDFTGTFYAVDGSRLRYDSNAGAPSVLYLPDGGRYLFPPNAGGNPLTATQYVDRHGNTLTYDAASRRWTDTLGRQIGELRDSSGSLVGGSPLPASPARGDFTYTLPGPGGSSIVYTLRWRNLSEAGVRTDPSQPLRYTTNRICGFPQDTILLSQDEYLFNDTNFDRVCATNGQPFDPVVLWEVELPTEQKYRFTYNVFGEIDKISLPTGGYERYVYEKVRPLGFASAPYDETNRGVVERHVSAKGDGTDELPWTYSASTQGAYTVRITAPDGTYTERLLRTGYPNNAPTRYGFDDARAGMAYEERAFDAAGVMLRRSLTEWVVSGPAPGGDVWATRNPRAAREVSILLDTGGDAQAKTTVYTHDTSRQFTTGLNVTAVAEHDYAQVSQAAGQTGAISASMQGPLVRTTETDYLDGDEAYRARNLLGLVTERRVRNAAGTVVARSQTLYDETDYAPLACGAAVGWLNPETSVRGLATTTRSWLDIGNKWVETHAQYDLCGSPRKSWGAHDESDLGHGGKVSEVEYAATYHRAYPTLTRTAVPDPTGQYGSATALVTETTYDAATGRVLSTEDANDQTTSFSYANEQGAHDPLGRLRKVSLPDGGWTKYTYGQNVHGDYVITETLQNTAGVVAFGVQFFDGLGRPSRSFVYENQDSTKPYLTTDTEYDRMGRVRRASLRYRSAGAATPPFSTDKWVETIYDALGRVKTVTTKPDNALVTTSYSGNRVTVTDQAGKQRRSVTDALGRLTQVVEDPAGLAYATDYTYDVLGNLRKVNQGGQLRFFMYDSLGRLIRARNPEQGTHPRLTYTNALNNSLTGNTLWSMAYGYDAAGNLTSRVDARNVETTYVYDNLNRNTTVQYAVWEPAPHIASTPNVTRTYDGATLGRGRLWRSEAAQTARTTVEQYDATGRPLRQSQQFRVGNNWGTPYTVRHSYNLGGAVTSQTYPSDHTTAYTYDVAGRPASFAGNLGDGAQRAYSTGIVYDELGGMKREQYGTQTPLYKRLFYNSRGQLSDIRLGTYHATDDGWWNRGAILNVYSAQAGWTESGADNNGNLRKQMVFIPHGENPDADGYTQRTQFYGYDQLNRILSVEEKRAETDFFQTYDYDRWGNRTINAAGTWGVAEPQFAADAATNRLGVPAGQSGVMGYDAAGNLTHDTYQGGQGGGGTRAYDAEGRMTQAQFFSGQTQTALHTYDADGRRVKRQVGAGAEVWQVYGLGGELLAEYAASAQPSSPQKEYGYRAGELLVTAEPAGAGTLTNVSDGRPAMQSSTGWGGAASRAVDGNTDGAWASGSIAHTDYESQPWWQVDLQDERQISRVDFWLMTECCSAHGDFDVQVSDDGVSWSSYYVAGPVDSGNVSPNRTGRYVRVRLRGAGYLALAEVRVWAGTGGGGGGGVRWLVGDHLGTPRMVVDQSGTLAGVSRHDYLPFGEEVGASIGGRDEAQGYSKVDNVRQKFTGYERDDETGLDFAETRYYSPTMGRFTRPDDFLNDSDLLDPQSWNKYAYVRNNPLKYVDPTGEKADVKIQTDEEKKTGSITITASIGIYSRGNSNLTQEQLNQARDAIEKSIEGAWSGTFKGEDGITYTVTTDVTVQVYGNADAATEAGAQNVIGISSGDARAGRETSIVDSRSLLSSDSAPDTGTWKFDRIVNGQGAAHEFTHLLGAGNTGNRTNLSFSPHLLDSDPVGRYGNATQFDYRHALGGAIQGHRYSSRRWEPNPDRELGKGPQRILGRERNHTSTRVLRAPYFW